MSPIVVFSIQAFVVLGGVIASWFITAALLPTRWANLGWGILAWPLSQIFRSLFIIPTMALLTPLVGDHISLTTTIVYLITSGFFEETTRLLVFKYLAKNTRSWKDAFGFGIGHGGIEAILTVTIPALSSLYFLLFSDAIIKAIQESKPEEMDTIYSKLEFVQNASIWMAGGSIFERIVAIIFHIAMSLLVIKAVMSRKLKYWATAVLLHVGFNTVLITAAHYQQIFLLYLIMSICTLALVWAMRQGPLSKQALLSHQEPLNAKHSVI